MFSLIIALIAIALVAVLAGASVYYGTSAWSDNQSKAKYAEIVNQSEQISNAFLAFKINGNELNETNCNTGDTGGCLQQLVDAQYLNSIPKRTEIVQDTVNPDNKSGWMVDADGALYTTTTDKEACILANEKKGYDVTEFSHDGNGDGVPDAGVDTNSNSINDAVENGAVCIENA